jgi:chemotaxis protein CheC
VTDHASLLDDLEVDALTELVNIGVSRAAASLRQMVGRQVLLSIPSVEVTTQEIAISLMAEREVGPLVAVRQDFNGAFGGRALLIFPETASMSLVRAVVGEDAPEPELTEMEEEALKETGNVVLTNCLATMANMLRHPLEMSLPVVIRQEGSTLFRQAAESTATGVVLFLYINFAISERNIRGYLAVLMDMPSLEALKGVISDFISRVLDRRAQASGS